MKAIVVKLAVSMLALCAAGRFSRAEDGSRPKKPCVPATGFSLLGVAGVAWNRWLAIPANSRRFAEFLLKTPPFRTFVQHLNAARFAGSLATLVRSDVPLVEALQASAAVTPIQPPAIHCA